MVEIVVIGGGTATNSLVRLFSSLTSDVCYVLPISDNGGSSSELMRVIGGPAIGDIRSRINRLLQAYNTNNDDVDTQWKSSQLKALHTLFSYRLPNSSGDSRKEWDQIVDGNHSLWAGIESQVKELIRPFFININVELLKRFRPGREFKFEKASIGNLFLTGSRLFCGSLDSAIELMLRITMISQSIMVLPVLNTNFSHHISALLENGQVITGQSQISHPSTQATNTAISYESATPMTVIEQEQEQQLQQEQEEEEEEEGEDAFLPFTHPDLTSSQLHFEKFTNEPLPAPIQRIFYINPYGQEIHPRASSRVINALMNTRAVVYSIGSLYTSIIPTVLLQGIANAIRTCKYKILILNGESDRETEGMTAADYIQAIVDACTYSCSKHANNNNNKTNTNNINNNDWSEYISHLIYLDSADSIPVEVGLITSKGIQCHRINCPVCIYDPIKLEHCLRNILLK